MSSSKPSSVVRKYRLAPRQDVPQCGVAGAGRHGAADSGEEQAGSRSSAALAQHSPNWGGAADVPDVTSPIVAETLLAQSRVEAERIIAEALQQAQMLRQQAEVQGRQEGVEAGRAEAMASVEAEMRSEIKRMQDILQSLRVERARALATTEAELVELALAIARKVIGDAASRDATVIVEMAHRAARQLGQAGPFTLHVNPEDHRRLVERWPYQGDVESTAGERGAPREHSPAAPNTAERLGCDDAVNIAACEWRLAPDERVAPGGCIVTCGAGLIDARPETQLNLIQQAFVNAQGS